MESFKYVISVKQGLHAKNAMELSRAASGYESRITLQAGERAPVDCKNVLALMGLGARQGESLTFFAPGPDEEAAAGYLKGFLKVIL